MKKLILIFVVILFTISSCQVRKGQTKKSDESSLSEVEVKTISVKKDKIEQYYTAYATLLGITETDVYTKVPGKLIKKILSEGDTVEKDQVVCLIDRDEPAMEYTEASVKSPIKGVITKYFADIGESVMPQTGMSKPLFRVSDISKLKAEIYISEKDLSLVKEGQLCKIEVENFPEKFFYGKVTKKSTTLDPITNKAKIDITLDNKDMVLKNGMFTKINIVLNTKTNTIVVPKKSVIEEVYKERKIVYLVKENKAYEQEVVTGIETDTEVEIISGLNEGDEIIIEGLYGIIDGTPVRVVSN